MNSKSKRISNACIGLMMTLVGIGTLYGAAVIGLAQTRGFSYSIIICTIHLAVGLLGSDLLSRNLQ